MFGLIVSGRLVDTAPAQVDANKFGFQITDPDSINHIVIFMLGTVPFEAGFAASIHFAMPDGSWQLLGFISNDKPSAIFKVSKLKQAGAAANAFGGFAAVTGVAQIGISVEPIDKLQHETPDAVAKAPTASDLILFGQKMAENFVNFAGSFASAREQALRATDQEWIPLGALHRWHENFVGKMQRDPNFWRH